MPHMVQKAISQSRTWGCEPIKFYNISVDEPCDAEGSSANCMISHNLQQGLAPKSRK